MKHRIGIATEDQLSEVVVEKILNYSPIDFEIVVRSRKQGFGYLKNNVRKYNEIARSYPFLLLTDLDNSPCAPALISSWLDIPQNPRFLFRVAVREVEAWLLADREAISDYLNINLAMCPIDPDNLVDPKQTLLNLTRKSRNREIKNDLLAEAGSKSSIGLGYNSRLSDFVWRHWDVNRATVNSDSLKRAWNAICGLNQ